MSAESVSSSPTLSDPDTLIVTPAHPYILPRGPQVISADQYGMDPSPLRDDASKKRSSLPSSAGEALGSTPVPVTPVRQDASSQSQRRRAASKAHPGPPPPILVQRPTELHTVAVQDESPTSEPRRSTDTTQASPSGPVGLNISGLPSMSGSGSIDRDEESDQLQDLAPSPHRALFANATPTGAQASPLWQSFEVSPFPNNGSPHARTPSSVSNRYSLEVPYSPLGPRTSERRFDPTPNHGIHARNLSLYFPKPGAAPEKPESPKDIAHVPSVPLPAGGDGEKKAFGGARDWTFGKAKGATLAPPETPNGSKQGKRRGHHVSV